MTFGVKDHTYADCVSDEGTFSVSILRNRVVLISGWDINQLFALPTTGAVLGDLPLIFRTPEAVETSAIHYRTGFTNKDKFLESATTLLRSRKITEHDFKKLRAMIASCDGSPEVVRRRLIPLGYSMLTIAFEDKNPKLETSVLLLWKLICYLKTTRDSTGFKEHEKDPEKRQPPWKPQDDPRSKIQAGNESFRSPEWHGRLEKLSVIRLV